MKLIQFEDIIDLTDDDLITLLKHIPNDILLLAVLSGAENGITTRLCQVLSFQATIYFLEDLENFRLVAQPDECKSARTTIETLVNDLVNCEKIQRPTAGRKLKMAS